MRQAEPEYDSVEEVWDKKKVTIGVFLIGISIIAAVAVKMFVFTDNQNLSANSTEQSKRHILGNKTEGQGSSAVSNLKTIPDSVREKIAAIKEQITHLDAGDIASSSPQVQKVLQDIQALKDYPHNQARELCENMCKSL